MKKKTDLCGKIELIMLFVEWMNARVCLCALLCMNIYDDICVTQGNYGSLRPLNRMALTKETNIDEPLNNTWSYPHQQHTTLPQAFYMNSAITSECTLFIGIYPSQNFNKVNDVHYEWH